MKKNSQQLKTYHIKTYGCAMNSSDSERIAAVLDSMNLKSVNKMQDADVIVFNTCSVRQSAEDRVLGLKKNIQKLKLARQNTKLSIPITILTGCMCKRSWNTKIQNPEFNTQKYRKLLKRKMPWVDIIVEIKDIAKLPQLIKKHSHLVIKPFNYLKNKSERHYLHIAPAFKSTFRAYIPISTGCNAFCSYCIVPYARGKQINRPLKEIINEVKGSISKGYKDIMLLGQNVNSWSEPALRSETKFLDLLKAVDQIKGDFWLSFLSSHPNYFTDDSIDYFTKSKNSHIRPWLNLALQSGSDQILKKMNRKYTVEKFSKISSKLVARSPLLCLSTDIIVGFPGETKKDFQKTAEIMKKIKFDMAYINKYSPRKGTAADKFVDDVPWKEKKRRERILNNILEKTALEKNKKMIGKKSRVLIEKVKDNFAFGKTFNFKDIKIPLTKNYNLKTSDFVDVKVTKANAWSLEGEII